MKKEETFLFELISPEKLLFSEQVYEVVLPSAGGEATILPHHAPFMTSLFPGIVRVKGLEHKQRFVVYGGFADVNEKGCSVLADAVGEAEFKTAELAARIERMQEALHQEEDEQEKTKIESLLHQLTTISGVMTEG